MQSKSHITVVSEGRTFYGVRTPHAFSWVEAPKASASIQSPRPPRPPLSNLAYVLGQLDKLKLAKEDLVQRRQQAAMLSSGELDQLAAKLRAAVRAPAR
jgi:hypothetical protein